MVNVQRLNLLDSAAPNPSVETLLHAFLPHKFVDHTHAASVLSLVDQPDGEALAREVYDGRMGIVPYIAPGFGLAKAAAAVFEQNAQAEGLILHKHGIFTFGKDAREAYERMIEMVSLAESRLRQGRPIVFQARQIDSATASAAEIAPIIRGACALKHEGAEPTRFIADFRTGPEILAYVNGAELASYSQRGVVTPDHIIRTKNRPLVVPPPEAGKLDQFAAAVREAVAKFVAEYDAYFARENAAVGKIKSKLDGSPRVVLVPGVGLFGLGRTAKDAAIAADLAENTVKVVTDAEAIGRYEPLPESDLFALEYWSLEQAKLKGAVVKPLTGQVALVTGAGAIGAATAKALAADGAAVAILDIDGEAANKAASAVKGFGLECDVTKPEQVRAAFARVCERFGGVDIVVSNAGAAWQGRIGEVSDELLRKSFELNFFAHQTVAQEAVRIMLKQGTGGVLLVQSLQAGGQSRREFRTLWPAQGRRDAADASICARLRPGRHPLERRQCRPHQERAPDRRDDRGTLEGARHLGGRIYERQSPPERSHRRRRGPGLRRLGQGAQDDRPCRDGGRRQYRGRAALENSSFPCLNSRAVLREF